MKFDIFFQDGGTALFKASHKGHVDVVAELVSHGASLEILKVCMRFTTRVICKPMNFGR